MSDEGRPDKHRKGKIGDLYMIRIAKEIATFAHTGQVDKAGKPYVNHLAAVAAKLQGSEEKTVAWLHDVLEDTDYTAEQLSVFFPANIVEAVEALTKHRGEPYEAYLRRIAKNPLAVKVKMADLEQNADISRYDAPTDKDRACVKKYKKYRQLLFELVDGSETDHPDAD